MRSRPFQVAKGFFIALGACVFALTPSILRAADDNAAPSELARFTVRPGYQVTIAVPTLKGARFLALGPDGALYVSRPYPGDIVRFTNPDDRGTFRTQTTFTSGKPFTHALCWHEGWLWFATTGGIYKARDTTGKGIANEIVPVIPEGKLPKGSGHWWRSLLITADHLYTSIGDTGNITDLTDTEREKIFRFALDGSGKALFASGIRNTEKLLLRPGTDEVWGFDHGSDWFGQPVGDAEGNQPITDLNPPDEFNHYIMGGFYGHPFIVGNRLPRYEYLKRSDIHELAAKTISPEWPIGAHWATNGFCFIDPALTGPGRGLPADHAGDALVCCHGSWNSKPLVGYCVARVLFDNGHPYGLLKLVSTFDERSEDVLARPVDCVQDQDGSILFSSDAPEGRVYRLRYVGPGLK